MKLELDMPQSLILGNTPLLVPFALVGLIFVLSGVSIDYFLSGKSLVGFIYIASVFIGVFLLAQFSRRTQLVLDRSSGHVTCREWSWRGRVETSFPLETLSHAMVQTDEDADGKDYRLLLIRNDQNNAPVIITCAGGAEAWHAVKAINDWLSVGDVEPRHGSDRLRRGWEEPSPSFNPTRSERHACHHRNTIPGCYEHLEWPQLAQVMQPSIMRMS